MIRFGAADRQWQRHTLSIINPRREPWNRSAALIHKEIELISMDDAGERKIAAIHYASECWLLGEYHPFSPIKLNPLPNHPIWIFAFMQGSGFRVDGKKKKLVL